MYCMSIQEFYQIKPTLHFQTPWVTWCFFFILQLAPFFEHSPLQSSLSETDDAPFLSSLLGPKDFNLIGNPELANCNEHRPQRYTGQHGTQKKGAQISRKRWCPIDDVTLKPMSAMKHDWAKPQYLLYNCTTCILCNPPCIAHYKVDILCAYKVGFRSPLYIPTMGDKAVFCARNMPLDLEDDFIATLAFQFIPGWFPTRKRLNICGNAFYRPLVPFKEWP